MYTEEEAKKKWCPMVRAFDMEYAANRQYDGDPVKGTSCIASDCMMWRWNLDYDQMTEEGQGGDVLIRLKRKKGEPKLGYCGLAGKI